MPTIEAQPDRSIPLDTGVALERLSEKLTLRPNWQQNYLVLREGSGNPDPNRIKLALLDWLALEFGALTAAEISAATAQLMTLSTFAPDLKQIQQECFAAAVQRRYGDPRQLFVQVVRKIVDWSNGAAVSWRPVDAFLVQRFGARHLRESSYPDMEKSWKQSLHTFIVEGEPDMSTSHMFERKKEYIKFYANSKRVKIDFSRIKLMLSEKQ